MMSNLKLVMVFELRNEKNKTIRSSECVLAEEPENKLDPVELAKMTKMLDNEQMFSDLLGPPSQRPARRSCVAAYRTRILNWMSYWFDIATKRAHG